LPVLIRSCFVVDAPPPEPEGACAPPLELEGALSVGVACAVKEAACQRLRGAGDVAVSCARLEQIDASAVQILLALKRELAEDGRALALQEVPPGLRPVFALAGLLPLARATGDGGARDER
jgi:ABC-type transporter Mla MlaB component